MFDKIIPVILIASTIFEGRVRPIGKKLNVTEGEAENLMRIGVIEDPEVKAAAEAKAAEEAQAAEVKKVADAQKVIEMAEAKAKASEEKEAADAKKLEDTKVNLNTLNKKDLLAEVAEINKPYVRPIIEITNSDTKAIIRDKILDWQAAQNDKE